jgi:hypothetical protein
MAAMRLGASFMGKRLTRKYQAMPKARLERWHAITRARQRYGLHLTVADLEAVAADIQEGMIELRLVEEQSNRVVVYDCIIKGMDVRIVYDKMRKAVTSFLPRTKGVLHD